MTLIQEKRRAHYLANRERILADMKARRAANPEKYRAVQRVRDAKYRSAHRQEFLEKHKRRYWRATGRPEPLRPCPAVCECCGRAPTTKALASDHDPVTGQWRGWLCHYCNPAIGMLGDTIAGLQQAICYLTRTSVK